MRLKPSAKPKTVINRKGLWSPDEDQKLRDYILKYGHGCWSSLPARAGLQRNGKSCRLRWINYLRPGLKRGLLSSEEEQKIIALHSALGNKWSQIAKHLPGRTDNEVKNYWHSNLKKKVATEAQVNEANTKSSSQSHDPVFENTRHSLTYSRNDLEPLISTYNSLQNSEKSSKTHTGFLPDLVFSEWLFPSPAASCHFSFENHPSDDVKSTASLHGSSFMEGCNILNGGGLNGRQFQNEQNIIDVNSVDSFMLCPQFQSGFPVSGTGFAADSVDYMCSDPIIGNDVMYISR